jgi:UV damage endonuclease UvdE
MGITTMHSQLSPNLSNTQIMTQPRIGFACKYSELNNKGQVVAVPELNTRSTTGAWLRRQSQHIAEERLWDIMKHNIESAKLLVAKVGSLEQHLRMVRLSSDLLPLYTEPSWSYFWRLPDVRAYCEKHFAEVGAVARSRDVRLSFHPGQFCVLASDSGDVVERSIDEFEYHADMTRMMGFGQQFQDFKINVHISGRQGPDGIRKVYPRLSPEARNCLTLENEEFTHGILDCLQLSDLVPTVLDIHHHWIREGEYINFDSDSVKQVIDSWRGVRPTLHYSVSREDILVNHCANTMPAHSTLLVEGHKNSKLRAHSDYYWNKPVNEWAATFLEGFDIMCESKAKNLASFKFAEEYCPR